MSRAAEATARSQPGGTSTHAVYGVMAAIVLLALNLRTLVAGLPPLLDDIRDDLGLSGLAGGLLTALPVLGFGAFAPLAPRLSRRVSVERLLVACALITAVAAALRGAGGVAPLFAGCALAGFAVAIVQALLPAYIRATHPEATGMLTGAYSMSLTLGAALAAALAVPLEEWLGSWEASLAAWSVPALIAAAVWLPSALRAGTRLRGESPPGLWGNRLAWNVSLFMGDAVDGVLRRAHLDPDHPRGQRLLRRHGWGAAGAERARAARAGVRRCRCSRRGGAARSGCCGGSCCSSCSVRSGCSLAIDVAPLWIVVLGHRAGRGAGARADPAGAPRRRLRHRWRR